jgi:predicted RNA-binding protein YlxR (DUF448 family)
VNFVWEEGKEKRTPVRQCALTRSRVREEELLRFVLDPDGRVVPDIKRKLPGRGVWIMANREAVAEAVRRQAFSRGFKQAVAADTDLADLVASLLSRAAMQDLALANKAGNIVAGFAKVEKAIKSGNTRILVHASDASLDGCRKLDRLAHALLPPEARDFDPVTCFGSAELSAALGKTNVVHAAVADGGAGRTFFRSARRYIDYMGPHPATGPIVDTPEQDKA